MRINHRSIRVASVVASASCLALLFASIGSAATGPQTITFTEISQGSTFAYVDNAPKSELHEGFPEVISAGDQFVATSPLVSSGKRIGKERIACTATGSGKSFNNAHFFCLGSFQITGGTLFATTVLGPGTVKGAIIGGTSAYAGASGTFSVKEGKTSSVVTVVLE